MKLRAQFRASGPESKTQKMRVKWTLTLIPSTIEHPEHQSADLIVVDDHSWCFLSETSKLASNTSSFAFVVHVDGIKTLDEEETSSFTLAVIADMVGGERPE